MVIRLDFPPVDDLTQGTQPEQSESDSKSLASDTKILLWSGIALLVLVVVAFVLTFYKPPPPDPGTPEGIVQLYLQASIEGRRTDASSYLSDSLREKCRSFEFYPSRDAYRIEVTEASVEGSEAEVTVLAAEQPSGIFDSYGDRGFYAYFSLQQSGDSWRITEAMWPWYDCPGLDKPDIAPPTPPAQNPDA